MNSHRSRFVGGAVLLLLTNGFALLIPWYMKLAVEGLQHPGGTGIAPARCALIITFLALLHGVTRIYSRTLILNAARLIEYNIRHDMFRRLMQLDLAYFSESRSGDILSRFSNDLANVRMLAGFGVMSAINTVILYIAAVTMMVRINPVLTFWAVLPFPLMVLIVKKVSGRVFQRSMEVQEELARLSSLAEETVSAVRLIKSYCREAHFEEKFGETARSYLDHSLRLARLRGVIIPVMAMATGAGTLIVLFLGGRLVISSSITLGDFVAFSGYLSMLVWPTAVMGWILTLAQRGAASMARLAVIMNAEASVVDRDDVTPLERIDTGIEFRDLSFGYGDKAVLSGFSLTVRAGETIGITGEVGSGKTTLLRLLPRLLAAPDNSVLIDGRDINGISLDSLRRMIGYVPQETFLFSRSIAENIGYGLSGKSDQQRIEQTARQAGLLEDVASFSARFDTEVGEKGVMLSGGQKQRLAIARAIAGDPQLLLLDDPLSAVDAGREDEILNELGRFYAGRTVLIVSQRVSAFRDCSRIVVLKEGRVAEEGTQAELLANNGLFAEMNRMQRLQQELL